MEPRPTGPTAVRGKRGVWRKYFGQGNQSKMPNNSEYDYWELEFSDHLTSLINACPKICTVECCGIKAFDFSPLHIASFLAGVSGGITPKSITLLTTELHRLIKKVKLLREGPGGIVCYTRLMNENFTKESFEKFASELENAIRLSSQVEAFVRSLQK